MTINNNSALPNAIPNANTKSTENTENPLILVDGSAYLYRAYHALPELSAPNGAPTGAIFGVLNMLHKLRASYPNSPFVVVFDAKGGSHRNVAYAEYKANRPPMPNSLQQQIEPLHACIKALGFTLLCIKNVEADDVLGTLALRFSAHYPVLICSSDKDMAQLVNDKVHLFDGIKNIKLNAAEVKAKFGVAPHLIIDFLALMGDSSDNIPGVSGIGSITAQKLLNDIGNLDAIYADLTKINHINLRGAKSVISKLAHEKQQAYLSRSLATIKTDVELNIELKDLVVKNPDTAQLQTLYTNLGFNKWLNDLDVNADNFASKLSFNQQIITTKTQFNLLLKQLQNSKIFSIYLVTSAADAHTACIVGIALAFNDDTNTGEAVYIPLRHSASDDFAQLDASYVLASLQPIFENPNLIKATSDGKFCANVLAHEHPAIQLNISFDNSITSYVLNPAAKHDLSYLANKYLNYQAITAESVIGKGAKQQSFAQIAIESCAKYANECAYLTLQVHNYLWNKLEESHTATKLVQQLELPLLHILAKIEQTGVLVDANLLNAHSLELASQMQTLENQAFELAGESFNLASPKQLGVILFDKLKLPAPKTTSTGQASTNESVLSELANNGHKIAQIILQHRSLSKLKNTYVDKLPKQINKQTGRIHTVYHQTGTNTGRLSSSDPNLQNIPIRTNEGRKIRQAFIAPSGYKILAADYSQIELRIMAHIAKDQALITAFNNGADIHQATAAEVFNIPFDQVSKDKRRYAKAINFGLIYGMSAFGLARELKITRLEALQYIDNYFTRYPQVASYMERTRQQVQNDGFVSTLFGRKLYIPGVKDSNKNVQQAALRAAINAPIQGSAADIIKYAMLKINNECSPNLDLKIIMQVHDELVFEVKNEHVKDALNLIKNCMTEVATLDVPLIVDIGIGDNLDDAH